MNASKNEREDSKCGDKERIDTLEMQQLGKRQRGQFSKGCQTRSAQRQVTDLAAAVAGSCSIQSKHAPRLLSQQTQTGLVRPEKGMERKREFWFYLYLSASARCLLNANAGMFISNWALFSF